MVGGLVSTLDQIVFGPIHDKRGRRKSLPQSVQPSTTCHYHKGSPKSQAGLEGGLLILKHALQPI